MSVRTIRHWDAGRNRVPWSVVRLLRLVRAGELGGLDEAWEGWTINRHGLRSPCGRIYPVLAMRHWWLTIEQARFWREGYDLATTGGVGAPAPTVACAAVPLIWEPGRSADSTPAPIVTPAPGQPRQTALADPSACEKAPEAPDAGKAGGAAGGRSGAPLRLREDVRWRGGHGVNVAPLCNHETANHGGNPGACNMEQTAPVSHSSPFGHVPEFLPLANRGGTNLNGAQSDATLASLPEPSRKGVA